MSSVPSKPLFHSAVERDMRHERRQTPTARPSNVNCPSEDCNADSEDEDQLVASELTAAEALLQLKDAGANEVVKKHFGVQVNVPKFFTLSTLITCDKSLCSFTGLQSFELLNAILDAVKKQHRDTRQHRLEIKERVILTFVKLKLNLTYSVLALLFGITPGLCKTYFGDTIVLIEKVLRKCIVFLPTSVTSRNMPRCFTKFQDTHAVVDCTEIKMQRPKCLCCRVRFYSHYKCSETVKFMTAVSPSGLIMFVSNAYGGRASDKLIFESSGIINHIEAGSAVMVDKGFYIDQVCKSRNVKVYQPPFLRKKVQLSEEEAQSNSEIAAARVHIERCNQRIKTFKILSETLPTTLIPYIDSIFKVICSVTNISTPILSQDKFLTC